VLFSTCALPPPPLLLLLLPPAAQFVPPGELVEGVQLAPPDNPFARLMGKQGSYDVNRCASRALGTDQLQPLEYSAGESSGQTKHRNPAAEE
jgi:hypothetical protein